MLDNKKEKFLFWGCQKQELLQPSILQKHSCKLFYNGIERKNENNNEKCLTDLKNAHINVEIGKHSNEFIENATYAVASPGIPPKSEIFEKLKEKNIKVISEIELAYKNTKTPFVAITGTNGKTTTTMLVSHILSSVYKAPVCGNIGVPPISLIDEKNDYLVCEVSSFQLENTNDFSPIVAVFTNFTPDHINYHGSLENYFEAKAKMFKNPKFAVFNAQDNKINDFAKNYKGEKFYFDDESYKNSSYLKNNAIYFKQNNIEEKIVELNDIKLVGHHNLQNVMCSIIVAKLLNVPNEKIEERIKSFESVEHRIELVQSVKKEAKNFTTTQKATNPKQQWLHCSHL
ncbi:MAG: UDP-N-acetylmuramoyl-L-alanine--D-glutamate ligase [Candidatus Melainabacteria bacterium]|nr:MAG: UDP-N-acetylmuramoyl-L-alanine--D-glutamate ligase [Candidatus Melainabacteria bacterium]